MELKPIATAIVASTALALSLPLWAAGDSEAESSAIESESQTEMDSQSSSEGAPLSEEDTSGASEEGISGASDEGMSGASEEGISGASEEGVSGASEEGMSGASEEGMSGASEEGTARTGDAASMDEPAAAAIDPADYDGKDIVTADGEDVGTVSKVVLHNTDQNAYAVVGVGGFLGIGATQAAIPTSELTLKDDQLVLSSGITKESLKAGMKYEEAEFSALEATTSPAAEMEGETVTE